MSPRPILHEFVIAGESPLVGAKNRILQGLAMWFPGSETLRVPLHGLRGVKIGSPCFIGMHALIETSHPKLVTIGSELSIGIRATLIAHFRNRDVVRVTIQDDVSIGPRLSHSSERQHRVRCCCCGRGRSNPFRTAADDGAR